jgi:hypothetical protein
MPTASPGQSPTAMPSSNPSAAPTPFICDTTVDYAVEVSLASVLQGPYKWEFYPLAANNTIILSTSALNTGEPGDNDYSYSKFCAPCGEYFFSVLNLGSVTSTSSPNPPDVVDIIIDGVSYNSPNAHAAYGTGKYFMLTCKTPSPSIAPSAQPTKQPVCVNLRTAGSTLQGQVSNCDF